MCDCERVRQSLMETSGRLADLIGEGRFPGKGRSIDEKSSILQWWDDHRRAIDEARYLLGDMTPQEWLERWGGW